MGISDRHSIGYGTPSRRRSALLSFFSSGDERKEPRDESGELRGKEFRKQEVKKRGQQLPPIACHRSFTDEHQSPLR
jgi:hypothetical protein